MDCGVAACAVCRGGPLPPGSQRLLHVAKALLVDQLNTEGFTLWLHLNKEEGGLPLTKTLEAQTELAPAQYQFKHLSFQEGLFAQHLLIQADAGWEGWETDETASEFLNNPFMNNTCRIAAGHLGSLLARQRDSWDSREAPLTPNGRSALWFITDENDTAAIKAMLRRIGERLRTMEGRQGAMQSKVAALDSALPEGVVASLDQLESAIGLSAPVIVINVVVLVEHVLGVRVGSLVRRVVAEALVELVVDGHEASPRGRPAENGAREHVGYSVDLWGVLCRPSPKKVFDRTLHATGFRLASGSDQRDAFTRRPSGTRKART